MGLTEVRGGGDQGKDQEGLESEAPIAPKLHKRPARRRRAKQVYEVSKEGMGKGLGEFTRNC